MELLKKKTSAYYEYFKLIYVLHVYYHYSLCTSFNNNKIDIMPLKF